MSRRRRLNQKNINLTIEESNQKLIDLIKKDKPFIVSRLGIGSETSLTYNYIKDKNLVKHNYSILSNNAGIYCNNENQVLEFIKKYNLAIQNSNFLSCFSDVLLNEQYFFKTRYNLNILTSRVLEPFYILQNNEIPWTHYLKDKRILIVNPFVESFQKQMNNGWKIFEDKSIFLPGQYFNFYKSFNTAAGNHQHSSWLETFEIMKDNISKIDFDIALLGCGGYGLPLCNFIKMEMKKSAVYIGGGLQLLFGIKGKRWENHPIIGKIIKDNGKFISPSGDEILNNNNRIEGGCYW